MKVTVIRVAISRPPKKVPSSKLLYVVPYSKATADAIERHVVDFETRDGADKWIAAFASDVSVTGRDLRAEDMKPGWERA